MTYIIYAAAAYSTLGALTAICASGRIVADFDGLAWRGGLLDWLLLAGIAALWGAVWPFTLYAVWRGWV